MLDLTKGYWQVPLSKAAREKTAFATPGGLFQYTVLPFGVHGAPATFQQMMDQLLRPHQTYAAAYIDDIIIHSTSWDIYLWQLWAVLGELRKSGLPASAAWVWRRHPILGYQVGRGNVQPQETKVTAIRDWPRPTSKKQVMLVTDHAPLKWMAGAKDTNAQVTRWFLALQYNRFQVDHRPSREHGNADALSHRDACLWSVRSNPRFQPAVEECGNPASRPRRGSGGRSILQVANRGRQEEHSCQPIKEIRNT